MSIELKDFFYPGKQNLLVIYILYLAGLISPVLSLVGVVMAYVNKDCTVIDKKVDSRVNANSVSVNGAIDTGNKVKPIDYNSHYIFLYRTFWISLIIWAVSIITTFIFIGPFIYMMLYIWYIVRMVIGINLLMKDKPHPRPHTLLFT